jgi:hypothetical protein
MMIFGLGDFFDLGNIDELYEIIEMKHRIVFAVLTEIRHVVTEIHIFQMIGDKAAIAPLDPLSVFFYDLVVGLFFHKPNFSTMDFQPRLPSACECVFNRCTDELSFAPRSFLTSSRRLKPRVE